MRLLIAISFILSSFSIAGDRLLDRGFPAHDREWLPADYEKAAKLLCEQGFELPTLADNVSAPYLLRLNSTANFAFFRNKSLPLQQRLPGYMTLQTAHNNVLKRYAATSTAEKTGQRFHAEMALLMGFSLKLGAESLPLIEEFIPTIAKDDKFQIRMEGVRKIHAGLTQAFHGAITSLSETQTYDSEDLSTILSSMEEVIPAFAKIFSANNKAEVRKALTALKPKFSKDSDKKSIDAILRQTGD